jgi:hypothetical protein
MDRSRESCSCVTHDRYFLVPVGAHNPIIIPFLLAKVETVSPGFLKERHALDGCLCFLPIKMTSLSPKIACVWTLCASMAPRHLAFVGCFQLARKLTSEVATLTCRPNSMALDCSVGLL